MLASAILSTILANAAAAVAAVPRDIYLSFGGGDSVNVGSSATLAEGSVPLTVAVWAKPAALGTDITFVSKADTAGNFQWWLGRDKANRMLFAVKNAAGTLAYAYATSATADVNWHQVAGVYDGAKLSLYIDGIRAATSAAFSGAIAGSHVGICVGAIWNTAASACTGGPFMTGALDDVRIYLRGLPQTEIQQTMNTELTGSETSLAVYYNLDDAGGQLAYDLAGGHHGILGTAVTADAADPAWVGSGPDVTKPIAFVTSPAAAQSLGSTIPVTSFVSDNVGVVGVQYTVDGANFGTEITIPPFNTTLNPSTLSSGTHTIAAIARDAAGNRSVGIPVTFTVPGGVSGCHNLSLGGGWTCVDTNAVSATAGPVVRLGLVHNAAVPAHATIVVFADSDMVFGDGTMSCADNAGNVFTRAPMGRTTIDNGSHVVRDVSYWYVLDSKAKASGYQASCTFATTGEIEDLDMSVMVFTQDNGLPSPGIDTYLPWASGYSASGTCPCQIVPGGQTLVVTQANDLILGGGNMNGGFPQVNRPFVGVDGDGVYTGAAYFTSAATSTGPGAYTLVWYDTLPNDGRASTMFALRPSPR